MTDDEVAWVVEWAIRLDCLVFVIKGKWGGQPVLFPRRLYASATLQQV